MVCTITGDDGKKMREILGSFLLLLAVAQNNCNQLAGKTYQRVDAVTGDSVTCEKCPPGTYVLSHCTKDKRTVCADCPERHYTEVWNYVNQCRYCNIFCTEDQYEKEKCSSTHNRVCECKAGYFLNYDLCFKHSECLPGKGVSQNGTAHTDVECTPCSDGTFSSEHSSTKACQKHSECMSGERVIPGDEKHDTFCTTCKNASQGGAVCNRAVLEFVSQAVLSPKHYKRLVRAIKRNPGDGSDLQQMLISLQRHTSDQPFVKVIVKLLDRAKLPSLKRKVERWFLHV
ncbi:hypothetical protein AGOR_G00153690 [Albula goreensis]|uniref:TNFR-Cys domain-containing protein n=1 Tax=Albula goreensis TaxID=1534307 RepID=A0A8T3D282_9TELE|nr:hypothetical protein AGOR_G00153690 [Albula goreensis]